MCECIHCKEKIKKLKEGTTIPLLRHVAKDCPILKGKREVQGQLNLKMFPGKSDASSMVRTWKFDNARM